VGTYAAVSFQAEQSAFAMADLVFLAAFPTCSAMKVRPLSEILSDSLGDSAMMALTEARSPLDEPAVHVSMIHLSLHVLPYSVLPCPARILFWSLGSRDQAPINSAPISGRPPLIPAVVASATRAGHLGIAVIALEHPDILVAAIGFSRAAIAPSPEDWTVSAKEISDQVEKSQSGLELRVHWSAKGCPALQKLGAAKENAPKVDEMRILHFVRNHLGKEYDFS
jgi:hypothetical protein